MSGRICQINGKWIKWKIKEKTLVLYGKKIFYIIFQFISKANPIIRKFNISERIMAWKSS